MQIVPDRGIRAAVALTVSVERLFIGQAPNAYTFANPFSWPLGAIREFDGSQSIVERHGHLWPSQRLLTFISLARGQGLIMSFVEGPPSQCCLYVGSSGFADGLHD